MKNQFLFKKLLGFSRLDIQKPTVEGIENLPKSPCIVSTTHLSDIDVQEVLMAVADKRRVGLICHETMLKFFFLRPFVAIMGRDNFFPITAVIKKGKVIPSLKIEDLREMKRGILEGRTMIVAGHNPIYDVKLPKKPGVGAVILAHMANVVIVPAVLDIDSNALFAHNTDFRIKVLNFIIGKRPKAKIYFCKPIQVSKIPNNKLKAAINLYDLSKREKMSPKDLAAANETLAIIKGEASQVMLSFASKLPPQKRGESIFSLNNEHETVFKNQ